MVGEVSTQDVMIERAGPVARISINRPERRNALSLGAMQALIDAFVEAAGDPAVWEILVQGVGEQAFCAGADLKEAEQLARSGKGYPHPMTGPSRNLFELVLEIPKPTIAAINGVALGAGCELALACDVRLMVDDASIGLPEAKRGMGANFGCVMLPRLVPRAIAFDLLYSGRPVQATEAKQIGLVSHIFGRESFAEEVDKYVDEIATSAPLTVQRYKHMALKGWELPVHAALRLDVGPNPYASEDRAEGARAFVEKRRPVWQGK